MPTTDLLARAIRTHQFHQPEVGHWWRAIHTFLERTIEEYWYTSMPYPILNMDTFAEGLSYYEPQNGMNLPHVIGINPLRVRNGTHVAELLAHELVHLHMNITNEPTVFNVHGDRFHELMFVHYGIATHGENGMHTGNDGRWDDWLEENLDIQLERFQFSGGE